MHFFFFFFFFSHVLAHLAENKTMAWARPFSNVINMQGFESLKLLKAITYNVFSTLPIIKCRLSQNVSGFPTLPRFFSDPKHFIVNCEQNIVKYAEKWGGGGGVVINALST